MSNKEAAVTIIGFVLSALIFSQMISCERHIGEMRVKCLTESTGEAQTLRCKEIY